MKANAGAIRGLYAIIDSTYIAPENFASVAREIAEGGCRIIQARAKDIPAEDIMEQLRKARHAAAEHGAVFIINDSPQAALECGADGVHLGQGDASIIDARRVLGGGAIIGVSTHNTEEALRAEEDGADYISLGPVFPTRTKKDADEPKGLSTLKEVASSVAIPVVAIGGITALTAREAISCGASAAAIISDILLSGDIRARVSAIISSINGPRS